MTPPPVSHEFTNSEIGAGRVEPGMWLIRPRHVAYHHTEFKRAKLLRVAEVHTDGNVFCRIRWDGDTEFTTYHIHEVFIRVELVVTYA